MRPPDAVQEGKVEPLSDEDRLTLVRWIDLGCPIDLTSATEPEKPTAGWALDDQRPTLTVTYPTPVKNEKFDRILIGAHDYGSGLDMATLEVTADFAINGAEPGVNLAGKFRAKSQGVWELKLDEPVHWLTAGALTVSVQDSQRNITRIDRTFSVPGAQ